MSPLFFRRGNNGQDDANTDLENLVASAKTSLAAGAPKSSWVKAPASPVSRALHKWAQALMEETGALPLANVECLEGARLDLSHAHPSGLAQLLVGRPTKLSLLLRESSVNNAGRTQIRNILRLVAGSGTSIGSNPQAKGTLVLNLACGIGAWRKQEEVTPAYTDEKSALAAVGINSAESDLGLSQNVSDSGADLHSDSEAGVNAALAGSERAPMPTPPQFSGATMSTDGQRGSESGVAENGSATSANNTGSEKSAPAPVEYREITYQAPILIQPLRVSDPTGDDPVLCIGGPFELNPILVAALGEDGVYLRQRVQDEAEEGALNPQKILQAVEYIATSDLTDFKLSGQIFVAPLVPPSVTAAHDVQRLASRLVKQNAVAAVAGDEKAKAALAHPLPLENPFDRDPGAERGIGDLEAGEITAVEMVALGRDMRLEVSAGSRPSAVLASIVADAAASGRSILHVTGRASYAKALEEELGRLGAQELYLDLHDSADPEWVGRNIREGLRLVSPEVDDKATLARRSELLAARNKLSSFVQALHTPGADGRSPYQVLESLAQLTSKRPGPRTRVRLDAKALGALQGPSAKQVRAWLLEAAELGAFDASRNSRAWAGAKITDDVTAQSALDRARDLAEVKIGPLMASAQAVAERTGLTPAQTLAQWSEQIQMINQVAICIDTFTPAVFERSVTDLIAATATRAWRRDNGISMGWTQRRRLVRQARAIVRPGVEVADLHSALVEAEEQRTIWRRHSLAGGWPRLPEGLTALVAEHETALLEIERLQAVLPTKARGDNPFVVLTSRPSGSDEQITAAPGTVKTEVTSLVDLPFASLLARLNQLVEDGKYLRDLPKRTQCIENLERLGFNNLLADLYARQVPASLVEQELDLAAATTCLTRLMMANPALAGIPADDLGALLERYCQLDSEHTGALAGPVLRAVVRRLRKAEVEDESTTIWLDKTLSTLNPTLAELPEKATDLVRLARPITLVPLRQVASLLPLKPFSLVIFDGISSENWEALLPALGRAKQILVIDDLQKNSGDGLSKLREVLPAYKLPVNWGLLPSSIVELFGTQAALPDGPSQKLPNLVLADGRGVPNPKSGFVDSSPAEVDTVCAQVWEHVCNYPRQSLAVVTLTPVHAQAVSEAIRHRLGSDPVFQDFVRSARCGESFVVTDARGASRLKRDRVIFSVGLGKTPHGMVLHSFGPLEAGDGLNVLANVVSAARQWLTVVSSVKHDEFDRARIVASGGHALLDLLRLLAGKKPRAGRHLHVIHDGNDGSLQVTSGSDAGNTVNATEAKSAVCGAESPVTADADSEKSVQAAAENTSAEAAEKTGENTEKTGNADETNVNDAVAAAGDAETDHNRLESSDPLQGALYADLIHRLEKAGAVVHAGSGPVLLTVASSQKPEEPLVALLPDDAAYAAQKSLRARDRHLYEKLRARGWSPLRVFAIGLFVDPKAVTDEILQLLNAAAKQKWGYTPNHHVGPSTYTAFGMPQAVQEAQDASSVARAVLQDAENLKAAETAPTPEKMRTGLQAALRSAQIAAGNISAPMGIETGNHAPVAAGDGQNSLAGANDSELETPEFDAHSPELPPFPVAPMVQVTAPRYERPSDTNAPVGQTNPAPAVPVPNERGPRPDIIPGRPLSTYGDDELDDLMAWLVKDGVARVESQWRDLLAQELELKRRNAQIDAVLGNVVRRCPLLIPRENG